MTANFNENLSGCKHESSSKIQRASKRTKDRDDEINKNQNLKRSI